MSRHMLRCDYCGVFHRLKIESEDGKGVKVEVENYSAIVYPIVDVQQMNTSNDEGRHETGTPGVVGEKGAVGS
jgi:uncharacterized Zn finger protein